MAEADIYEVPITLVNRVNRISRFPFEIATPTLDSYEKEADSRQMPKVMNGNHLVSFRHSLEVCVSFVAVKAMLHAMALGCFPKVVSKFTSEVPPSIYILPWLHCSCSIAY